MSLTSDAARIALGQVLFPGTNRDVVALGIVTEITVDGASVTVDVRPGTDDEDVRRALASSIEAALKAVGTVDDVTVRMAAADQGRAGNPFDEQSPVEGVQHVVAVASGKGGVGKSTVAANLAAALAQSGSRVGLLDADVYGPSLPIMFGCHDRPQGHPGGGIHPLEAHGVRLMSIGFFLDEKSPVMWRGPLVMGIVRQFLRDVDWGELDVLVVDLPPGTGDATLTLVQQVPLSGGIVVTTPQDVALLDVGRGMAMFEQVGVPVLGVIENMAEYVCPSCGHADEVFGADGGTAMASRFSTPLLARVPIIPAIRTQGDAGTPFVLAEPDHAVAESFRTLAQRVVGELARRAALDDARLS